MFTGSLDTLEMEGVDSTCILMLHAIASYNIILCNVTQLHVYHMHILLKGNQIIHLAKKSVYLLYG